MKIKPLPYLDRTVTLPGSKSYTQRALVIAALAEGKSILRNGLTSEDTDYLIQALGLLGAKIRTEGQDIVVQGTAGKITVPERRLYLGNNGTALRLLTGLAALGEGVFIISGDRRLCERPVKPLLDALRLLGITTVTKDGLGYPPITVHTHGLQGGYTILRNIDSSQYISSLLITAPLAETDSVIEIEGPIPSQPYVNMTVETIKTFGVDIEVDTARRFMIRGKQRYTGRTYAIEGDISAASYFFLAAALCRGTIRVDNINTATLQGDIGWLDILKRLGVRVRKERQRVEVSGVYLRPGDYGFDMGKMPDMVPTLAVLSAARCGRTIISNVSHLRLKESNRLAALVSELRRVGAGAEETRDGLLIEGGKLHGAKIETYHDHRIAMSFAMLGLAVPGIEISDPACVNKSFPEFWDELAKWHAA